MKKAFVLLLFIFICFVSLASSLFLGSEDPHRELVSHDQKELKEDVVNSQASAVSKTVVGDNSFYNEEEKEDYSDEAIDQALVSDKMLNKNKLNRFMLLAFHQRAETLEAELPTFNKAMEVTDRDGAGLVHWAVMGSCVRCLEVLIEKGFPVDRANKRGETALVFSSSAGESDMAQLLLDKGADPNIKFNKANYTLLMDAASEGNLEMVNLLLEHGARVNSTDKEGKSALHYAAKEGHTEVISLLKKYQIDTEKIDQKGFKAKDYALKYGFSDIVTIL